MAPNTATAGKSYAQKAADLFMTAVGMKSATKPEPKEDAFAEEKLNPVASANLLAERCRQYLSNSDVQKIREAFRYADQAHLGQFRNSGAPYITHPIAVAEILASWHMDAETIEAGLMHDVLEDTGITKIEMSEKFGVKVAELVDGVSKLDKLKFSSNEEAQAESFHKMLLAMSRDVRVILIKLADRLHNMRTLGAVKQHKKFRIAKETMDIYAPIASRLGLFSVYRELSDMSFSYMYPIRYRVLEKKVAESRMRKKNALDQIYHETSDRLAARKIRGDVQGKNKSLWRIYSKMKERKIRFSEVLDVHSFRVLVPTRDDCYRALGVIHELYKPVPGRFKDFVAIPKANGYQSLHTTVIGPGGLMVEFQIRTEEMHHICEDGITAHWLYRDRNTSDQLQRNTMDWLNGLLEIQKQSGTSLEFMENIKVDIFPDRVYVFSPRGRIIQLPKGSTAVDFAYQIHTDLGNCTIGCEINGETAPLTRELKNGEMINIIKGDKPTPNPSWLSSVRTGKARAEIRQYMRSLSEEGKIELGSKLLERSSKSHHLPYSKVTNEDWTRVCKANGFTDKNALLDAIGSGQKDSLLLLHQLTAPYTLKGNETATTVQQSQEPVLALKGQICKLAPCYTPAMDDVIIGHYIAGTNTLHVHRKDCSHVQRGMRTDPENWRDLQWNSQYKGGYPVKLDIELTNTHATLERLTSMIAQQHSSVTGFAMSQQNGVDKVELTILVGDTKHLQKIINAIRTIDTVRLVSRHLESTPAMKPVDVEIDE